MGETTDLADLHLDANGDALIEAVGRGIRSHRRRAQRGQRRRDAVDRRRRRGAARLVLGRAVRPGARGLLWGDVNPSAKLPMTFPKSLADTPTNTPEQYPGVFSDGSTTRPDGSTEIRQVDVHRGPAGRLQVVRRAGHRPAVRVRPRPVVHVVRVLRPVADPHGDRYGRRRSATVSFTVTNTGDRDGTEIPQVYLDAAGCRRRAGQAPRRLRPRRPRRGREPRRRAGDRLRRPATSRTRCGTSTPTRGRSSTAPTASPWARRRATCASTATWSSIRPARRRS